PTSARPSYDEFADGFLLSARSVRWFWNQYLGDREPDGYASPLGAPDLRGLPPARIIVAECDPLRDEGEAYAARLRDAGVDAVVSRYRGAIHGFVGLPKLFPIAAPAAREEGAWAVAAALRLRTR